MNSSPNRSRLLPLSASLGILALATVGIVAWQHARQTHHHSHDDDGAAVLSLNHGQRWASDEALRTGMQRIRDAVARALPAPEPSPLTPEQAQALATAVQENVSYLFAHCKLEPQADATLHVLITWLMAGAGALAADPASADGRAQVLRALREYPQYFDHPGWVPPASAPTPQDDR